MRRLAVYLVFIAGFAVHAKSVAASPLHVSDVVKSVEAHHPKLVAAEQKIQEARGKILSNEGIFDPKLDMMLGRTFEGDYPQTTAGAKLSQQTGLHGLSVYGRWKVGEGKFAPYESGETSSGGEGKVGVELPILRDGSIDEGRADLANAKLGAKIAQQSLRLQQMKIMKDAVDAYWAWVASARRVQIAQHLLELSEQRIAQISSRVEAGELPAIDVVDNNRTLLKRRGALVKEKRMVQQAALILSFYLRDDQSKPIVPDDTRLPDTFPTPVVPPMSQLPEDLERAKNVRPEIQALSQQLSIADNERRLAENQRLPRLNVFGEAGYDFGARAFGPSDKVVSLGLSFSFPIRQRKARGKLRSARSRKSGLRAERTWIEEQINVELRDIYSALDASKNVLTLATEERALSHQVEQAEREKYELGEVTLLTVTLREKAAAEADVRVVDAEFKLRKEQNRLNVATARGFDGLAPQ